MTRQKPGTAAQQRILRRLLDDLRPWDVWNTQPLRHRRLRALVTNSVPRRGSELHRPTRLILRLQFRGDEHIPQLQITHGRTLDRYSHHNPAEPSGPT
jgi:hypothetical protein